LRKVLGLRPAPEFEQWLMKQGIVDEKGGLLPVNSSHKLISGIIT
jgi:ethanolamine ammonia-lyase large subunit